ncbi:MAG: toprim domain-containing protein [Candidatus Rokubacteria bacterium]|nr:toprim domain-containing protein [Candidatus Rokubacteria bacterium]
MLAWPGHPVELYGWDHVLSHPRQLVLCEGEFDRLVLEAQGFYAATSTGGAGVFRPEWAEALSQISEVYICFDRDEAGQRGALRVGRMIPHAKLVELPEEVGEGGDVTDFFVRLGRTREKFLELLAQAKPVPPAPEPATPMRRAPSNGMATSFRQRIDRLKGAVPIVEVVRQYVELRPSGSTFVGLCPFHDDHNPSFTVYPATGTFHCYGCRRHGDVIRFLQDVEHLGFGQALEALEALWYPHGAPSPHS